MELTIVNKIKISTALKATNWSERTSTILLNGLSIELSKDLAADSTLSIKNVKVTQISTHEKSTSEKAADTIAKIADDQTKVISDLSLPTSVSGFSDLAIEWSSSNTDAVSNDGKITRSTEDQTATLTAKITDANKYIVYKEFPVTIAKVDNVNSDDMIISRAKAYMEMYQITSEKYNDITRDLDKIITSYHDASSDKDVATYFHAPPYTSERAKQKVIDLAKIVAKYAGPINLHVVNFTDIQLAIYEKCPHEELTIIMRRYMMKIAEHFANEGGSLALITGESIGQVASQTIHNLAITNEVCNMPVFRPCIGMDKQEIVDIAEKIGTFETSIQPFEDCCTIFVAKHPVTKGNLKRIKKSEEHLEDVIDDLMKEAIDSTEIIHVK